MAILENIAVLKATTKNIISDLHYLSHRAFKNLSKISEVVVFSN